MPLLKQLQKIQVRIREKGLLFYIIRPLYLWIFLKFIIRALRCRWSAIQEVIYILEMPLSTQSLNLSMPVYCINTVGSLLPFVLERAQENEGWKSEDYIEELKWRFGRGDRCFCLEQDGKIVSVMFVCEGSCYIDAVNYMLKIPKRVVGFYDVYTLPAFRGRHLYSVIFKSTVNSCLREGYHTAWMWIMPHNMVSLKVHRDLGMRHIFREITLCQRYGFRWHKIRTLDIDTGKLLTRIS